MVDVQGELDPESLQKIIRMAKESPRIIKASVYKGLRTAAEPAAQAARDEVLGTVPGKLSQGRTWTGKKRAVAARSYHTGLRAGIAAGVKVGIRAGNDPGVRITSGSTGLRPDQYRMNRTYNQPTFKHPVFGHGSAKQAGKEWFQKPIEKTKPQITEAVQKAMEEAAERLAGI